MVEVESITLTEAADGIGEMYTGIAQALSNAGYTGLQRLRLGPHIGPHYLRRNPH
jgi:hypothetical protein